MFYIKSPREVNLIRKSGQIIAELFRDVKDKIKDGITTQELDKWIDEFIRKKKVTSI